MISQESDIDYSWQKLLARSVTQPQHLNHMTGQLLEQSGSVCDVYPMRINPYFLELAQVKSPHLWKQVIPDRRELDDTSGMEDPLAEERDSPVPCITHRYPDRVLFLASSECAVYCRFCTRKRKIGNWGVISDEMMDKALRYIASHSEIRDVLVSGGDPLLLSDDRLDWILKQIRDIRHVEIIRIGSRVPGALPQRITEKLVRILAGYHPMYLNLHFNHADEITDETRRACKCIADAGIPMHSQTVLLREINDSPEILAQLFRELLKIRVKPYYLLQGDFTRGTNHFRTRVETGIQIMRELRGKISGMAMPTYIIDLPGGGGKVPMLPDYTESEIGDTIKIRNYCGEVFVYPQIRN